MTAHTLNLKQAAQIHLKQIGVGLLMSHLLNLTRQNSNRYYTGWACSIHHVAHKTCQNLRYENSKNIRYADAMLDLESILSKPSFPGDWIPRPITKNLHTSVKKCENNIHFHFIFGCRNNKFPPIQPRINLVQSYLQKNANSTPSAPDLQMVPLSIKLKWTVGKTFLFHSKELIWWPEWYLI